MDPIGPGNHERAWNDPPKFAFNSAGSTGSGNPLGRRRLLNKRVPVPIGPQASNSPFPPPLKPGDGPPIGSSPSGSPLTKPPTDMQLSERTVFLPKSEGTVFSPKSEVSQCTENRNSQDKLEEVETAFGNSLKRVSEDLKDNVREEITKRFEMMKTMWLDNKLNDAVQNRLLTLTKALDEGNFDDAWSIHQGLIVDFTSMCSPWMVGIKTLVIESRNQKKKVLGDEETDRMKTTGEDQSEVPMVSPLDIGKVTISDTKEESNAKSEADDAK